MINPRILLTVAFLQLADEYSQVMKRQSKHKGDRGCSKEGLSMCIFVSALIIIISHAVRL